MYINEKLKGFWHGCDYNPDQWLEEKYGTIAELNKSLKFSAESLPAVH